MSEPNEISTLYRTLDHRQQTCRTALAAAEQDRCRKIMLGGKLRAYTEMMRFIHCKYAQQLERGLGRGWKKTNLPS